MIDFKMVSKTTLLRCNSKSDSNTKESNRTDKSDFLEKGGAPHPRSIEKPAKSSFFRFMALG